VEDCVLLFVQETYENNKTKQRNKNNKADATLTNEVNYALFWKDNVLHTLCETFPAS
jgi:hypothetical protein